MLDVALMAHDQSPVAIHPAAASLDLPFMVVVGTSAGQSFMPGTMPLTARERRHRGRDAPPAQMLVEGSVTVRLVRDQLPGPCAWATSPLRRLHGRRYWLGQQAFMRFRAIYRQSHGQAIAVHNPQNFRAFAHLGFANAKVPPFAGAKCPSRNVCAHSISPWASNRLNNTRQIRSHGPCLTPADRILK
jgi:hypothetical protein